MLTFLHTRLGAVTTDQAHSTLALFHIYTLFAPFWCPLAVPDDPSLGVVKTEA